MKLSIGISPCPNDTFIFDAMLHGKVDTEGLSFSYQLEDVETLNQMAMRGNLDITKVSYGGASKMLLHYRILNAGGALGNGVGPLFVCRQDQSLEKLNPETDAVALPGVYTTAHVLFSFAYPQWKNKVHMPFHEIENAVLENKVRAGVIIHENRFTYQERGLQKIADLGEVWQKETELPIPLGGIMARRTFNIELLRKIDRIIARSIDYAWKHENELPTFVKEHAQEMSTDIMKQHIQLYVNSFSKQLGTDGRAAVWKLLETAANVHPEPFGWNYEMFVD